MQRHRGIVGEPDDGDEQHAGGEVAVAKQRRPHERLLGGKGVDEEQIERCNGDDCFDDDLAGAEQVFLLGPQYGSRLGCSRGLLSRSRN